MWHTAEGALAPSDSPKVACSKQEKISSLLHKSICSPGMNCDCSALLSSPSSSSSTITSWLQEKYKDGVSEGIESGYVRGLIYIRQDEGNHLVEKGCDDDGDDDDDEDDDAAEEEDDEEEGERSRRCSISKNDNSVGTSEGFRGGRWAVSALTVTFARSECI